jgi:nucleoside-diphosphate-sugar epimerase
LISVLVKKSCEDGKVRLDNLGQAVRDPLHVSDLADLTLKIYEQGVYQEVINAAGDDKNIISLREICTTVNPSVVIDAGTNNSDYGFLMDIRKAVDLGWEPQVDIRTWLQRVKKD